MENPEKTQSLNEAVQKRSTATAIRLGGALFIFFCLLFFYQRMHEKSEKIEQKLTIDEEFLGNALRIGDLFFVTQYLSSFVDSEIITGGSIREKGSQTWIVSVPDNLFEPNIPVKSVQFLSSGFQFFESRELKGDNGGVWEIHYFYKVSYSLFFYALMFSVLLGGLVFVYINSMLKGVVSYFNEPVLNISKDLGGQSINLQSTFEAKHYAQGQRFRETDEFVQELKKLVQEINLKNQKLKQAEIHEAISRLSRQVNHDIKSPLGALKVALENVNNNPDASRNLMVKSIQRIERILSDLQLSKTPEGKKAFDFQMVEIGPFLADFVAEKCAEYKGKNVTITLKNIEEPLHLEIDPTEISRAISNIINNAVEAGGESDVNIQVFGEIKGAHCEIAVKDNGPGVPLEIRDHIFEYGVSSKGTNDSGTGLSQAFEAIRGHQGSLSLKSDECGIYRIFEVRLPIELSKVVDKY